MSLSFPLSNFMLSSRASDLAIYIPFPDKKLYSRNSIQHCLSQYFKLQVMKAAYSDSVWWVQCKKSEEVLLFLHSLSPAGLAYHIAQRFRNTTAFCSAGRKSQQKQLLKILQFLVLFVGFHYSAVQFWDLTMSFAFHLLKPALHQYKVTQGKVTTLRKGTRSQYMQLAFDAMGIIWKRYENRYWDRLMH